MKNYSQSGKLVDVTAPYTVPAGSGVLVGAALFGIAQDDFTNGQAGVIATEGIFEVAKTSALVINIGDRLYWDDTNKVVNKTATAQVNVGVAVGAAVNPSPTVMMRLGPIPPNA